MYVELTLLDIQYILRNVPVKHYDTIIKHVNLITDRSSNHFSELLFGLVTHSLLLMLLLRC